LKSLNRVVVWEGEMRSVMRILVMVLLSASAMSAAQFSIQELVGDIGRLAGRHGCGTEESRELALRAAAHRIANLVEPAARELGSVVSCVRRELGAAK
jgi:hypothetical protein